MTNAPSASQRREFKTDLASLIRIFGDHLYAEADVFVREFVQNAHDSIRRRSDGPPGAIHIEGDRAAGTVVVRDNGVGMSEADIEAYLTTIGGSGTHATREAMLRGGLDEASALIGRFGIGLLSAFVVAEEVVVETRKAGAPTGYRLVARGGPGYDLAPTERGAVGTAVTLRLKASCLGLGTPEALRDAVECYCDFLPYPILVNGVQANTAHAPWHRSYATECERRRAFAGWVEAHRADTPLLVIPVDVEDPHVEGVLYVSDRRVPDLNTAGVVDVYQGRMFVRRADPDLLPPWAKFVDGVVDSRALTLTASRDAVRNDAQRERVRAALGRLIVAALRRLAREDPRRFRLLMRWHHYHVKGMALAHDDLFDAVADLVPFDVVGPATASEAPGTGAPEARAADAAAPDALTLPEYRARQEAVDDGGRTLLYYIAAGEGAAPFHQLCRAQGLLVLSAGLAFEEAFLTKYAERNASTVALQCVDLADSPELFTPLSEGERVPYLDLEYRLGRMLGEALPDGAFVVRTERFLPATVPALLTHAEDAETRRRLRVLQSHPAFAGAIGPLLGTMLEAQGRTGQSAVLHLNAASELVERLRAAPFGHPAVQSVWQLVCFSALLSGPYAQDPQRTAHVQQASYDALQHVAALLERHREREGVAAHGWLTGLARRTAHTSVYLLRTHGPSCRTENIVVEALRLVLEDAPYWFEVVPSEPWQADGGAPSEAGGLPARADAAHGFLVDLADAGPEAWARIGVLAAGRGDRPWVALEQDAAGARDPTPGVLASAQRLRYDWPGGPDRGAAQALADRFRGALGALDAVQRLLEARALRYLSAPYLRRVLSRAGIDAGVVPRLTSAFTTLEEVLEADASTLQRGAGLEAEVATRVLAALRDQR